MATEEDEDSPWYELDGGATPGPGDLLYEADQALQTIDFDTFPSYTGAKRREALALLASIDQQLVEVRRRLGD